jgi:hypothetical protein
MIQTGLNGFLRLMCMFQTTVYIYVTLELQLLSTFNMNVLSIGMKKDKNVSEKIRGTHVWRFNDILYMVRLELYM